MSGDCFFSPVPENVLYSVTRDHVSMETSNKVTLIMELKFTIMLPLYSFLYVTYSLHNNVTVHFILNTFGYWLQAV